MGRRKAAVTAAVLIVVSAVICAGGGLSGAAGEREAKAMLELTLRRRKEAAPGCGVFDPVIEKARWDAAKTAVIICDMWDRHWCKSATARVAEMAPRMNEVVNELRSRGALIIHCPSETMDYYKDHPGRALALSAPSHPERSPGAAIEEPPLPVDASDQGCPDVPQCPGGEPWTHQIESVEIKDGDAIGDGDEALNLIRERGITNVIFMGVHTNMCVLGRPFALRRLAKAGLNLALVRDLTDAMYNPRMKPYVDHFTGTDLVVRHIEKYICPTITSDQIVGGKPFRFAADRRRLPEERPLAWLGKWNDHWKPVDSYIEPEPVPEYEQAPEAAREAFRDLKFGVRIHWGLYSLWHLQGESWPFLDMSNEKRQEYQELYKKFDPSGFDADEWMKLFKDTGFRVFAFTTKHHEGFSLFDTKTRVRKRINWTAPGGPRIEDCDMAYSVMESPFKRDIVREICDAAHRWGIKIDLYFSHPDWFDADFRPYGYHPAVTPDAKAHPEDYGSALGKGGFTAPDPTPEEVDRMMARHRAQLKEILTNYGKIDMVCLDMWMGPKVWPQMRETMIELRRIQPDVMFRARGVGNYGDYYTPEGFVPGAKENSNMPWMVIYPLGRSFSYEPEAANHKGGPWIVRNLVDTVAKGGSFMVGVGPDENGRWHPTVIENFAFAGAWLKVDGEGIYDTRPREGELWKEGDDIRFTRTKDNRTIYAFAMRWPGRRLVLKTVKAAEATPIRMLGLKEPLHWKNTAEGLVIEIPESLQDESRRPSKEVYGFKIEGTSR